MAEARWVAVIGALFITGYDELAVLQNFNGRAVEQNIGETARHGAELAVDAALAGGFSARLAYTFIGAVVGQAYSTCVGTPCLAAMVAAGSRLPAVPENALYAGVSWAYAPLGFSTTLEAQGRARIYADDRNTTSAQGYWEFNWRGGFGRRLNAGDSASLGGLITSPIGPM
jgi:iron complex outermembrane receptor protein